MVTLPKCHVYNLQVTWFWLTSMLCKGCKNVKTGAFLPRFCINIQNDRKIADKALFCQQCTKFWLIFNHELLTVLKYTPALSLSLFEVVKEA